MLMFSKRSFLWFLMIAMAAGSYHFTDTAIKYNVKLESWKTATLAEFPVDLSQKGRFEGPLELITTRPCKVMFSVKVHSDQQADRSLLNGLNGFIYLYEGDKKVQTMPLAEEYCDGWPILEDNLLALFNDRPWDIGTYRVVVSISQPAINLKGIKQTFVAKYELCGIEYWPGIIQKGIAAFFGLVFLILALYLYSTRKRRIVVPESSEETADEYLR